MQVKMKYHWCLVVLLEIILLGSAVASSKCDSCKDNCCYAERIASSCTRFSICCKRGSKQEVVIRNHICAPGLVFNPYLLNCDSPENTFCFECKTVNGLFAHPDQNKSHLYVSCSNGIPSVKACPPGDVFDPDRGACIDPTETTTQATTQRSTQVTTQETTQEPTQETTLKTTQESTTQSTTQETTVKTTPTIIIPSTSFPSTVSTAAPLPVCPPDALEAIDFSCPRDGNFRCSNDCTRFVTCANEIAYIQACPPGLHYDEVNNECVWPNRQVCVMNSSEDQRCNEGEVFVEATQKCVWNKPQCTQNDTFTCIRDKVVACPSDCTKYVECKSGNPSAKPCSADSGYRCFWLVQEKCVGTIRFRSVKLHKVFEFITRKNSMSL